MPEGSWGDRSRVQEQFGVDLNSVSPFAVKLRLFSHDLPAATVAAEDHQLQEVSCRPSNPIQDLSGTRNGCAFRIDHVSAGIPATVRNIRE